MARGINASMIVGFSGLSSSGRATGWGAVRSLTKPPRKFDFFTDRLQWLVRRLPAKYHVDTRQYLLKALRCQFPNAAAEIGAIDGE